MATLAHVVSCVVSLFRRFRGFVVYESESIVAIVTMKSCNVKTGNMAQLWILVKSMAPTTAAACGADSAVCGNCKHRPANGRTCYVTLFQGPGNVWKAYRKGNYPFLKPRDYARVFAGRRIRFGAYGDPAFVPIGILRKLAAVADGFTGYTHQWQSMSRAVGRQYQKFVMASVDTLAEYQLAKTLGWRTFRVSATGTDNTANEISCPAAAGKAKCINCLLCCGTTRGAKDITIKVHGSGAKKFARKYAQLCSAQRSADVGRFAA